MSNKMENGRREANSEISEETGKFFDLHGHFLERYAGDSSIGIRPSPEDLGTFAIDLERGILYAETSRFGEKGWSQDKILSSVLHEFEHFREFRELLDEKNGDQIWQRHSRKLKEKRRFGILDNCFDDIKIDRRVDARAPVLHEAIKSKYREDLFPAVDYTNEPKHLQFAYALKRRGVLAEEKMEISPDVQAEITKLEEIERNGVKLLEYATRPETPMSMRLKLQDKFLVPIYEKFFQEDVEEKQKQGSGESGNEGGESANDGDADGTSGNKDSNKDGNNSKPQKLKNKTGKSDGSRHTGPSAADANETGEAINPEDYFKDEYDKFDQANPKLIDYSSDELKEQIDAYIKAQQGQSAEQEALEAYARAEGVSLPEIREYQRYFSQLENLENPETGEKVLEELRKIFKRIIAERKKDRYAPKHPLSEGEVLINPSEAVVSVLAGENEPEVWQSQEKKDLPQELFGDFDVTLVCDRSISMNKEQKAAEQKKAAILILEALKEFCDELDEMRSDLKHDLNVRSEVWGFGGLSEVGMLKPLSEQLTEKQRVSVYQELAQTPGDSTMDFLALEKIRDEVTPEEWRKIESKKLRKVIIVLTDGGSSDSAKVQQLLRQFETAGVAVAAIGITASGRPAETTYAPNGQTCESVENLAVVLADLLKQYLQDLLIRKR